MRITVLIISLLGALTSGFLGTKWLSDYEKRDPLYALSLEVLLGTAALSVVGGILVMNSMGLVGGLIMIAAGIAPVVTSGKLEILIFTFLTVLAGVLGVLVKGPSRRPPPEKWV